jgi:hypothetical protein
MGLSTQNTLTDYFRRLERRGRRCQIRHGKTAEGAAVARTLGGERNQMRVEESGGAVEESGGLASVDMWAHTGDESMKIE